MMLQPQEERAKLKERTAAYEKDSSLLVASGRGAKFAICHRDDVSLGSLQPLKSPFF